MKREKEAAGISLDLDNLWSYLKIHGDNSWKSYPSYFDIFIPEVINILEETELKLTFFVVGRDAGQEENIEWLQKIMEAGHDFGNHSYNHESWMHRYNEDRIREEICKTEDAILNIGGKKPEGFRGPGFSFSDRIIKVLVEKDYLYDASTLPTYIGPAARLYYFRQSKLNKEEKEVRKELFGKFSDGYKKIKPHFILAGPRNILEIPVTTIPILKIPFHLSYLLYISKISDKLMHGYLKSALELCKVTGTQPNLLLHPLDLIGGDQLKTLKFFPGMDIGSKRKREVFLNVIDILSNYYDIISLNDFAKKFTTTGVIESAWIKN